MYTEEQAKKLWCPETRLVAIDATCNVINVVSYNSGCFSDGHSIKPVGSNCVASGCMMWRWSKDGTGYCGKAGKTICR